MFRLVCAAVTAAAACAAAAAGPITVTSGGGYASTNSFSYGDFSSSFQDATLSPGATGTTALGGSSTDASAAYTLTQAYDGSSLVWKASSGAVLTGGSTAGANGIGYLIADFTISKPTWVTLDGKVGLTYAAEQPEWAGILVEGYFYLTGPDGLYYFDGASAVYNYGNVYPGGGVYPDGTTFPLTLLLQPGQYEAGIWVNSNVFAYYGSASGGVTLEFSLTTPEPLSWAVFGGAILAGGLAVRRQRVRAATSGVGRGEVEAA